MGVCYLTGVQLKKSCAEPFDDDCESLEHIIQNALSGTLSSTQILSHRANQDLNKLIDTKFVKIFEGFSLRLDFDRDRPGGSSVRGSHGDYLVDVVFKDNRFFPRRPYFDEVKRAIYADSMKTGRNYKQHLLNTGAIVDEEEIQIFDDMAGKIELPFSLDNKIFKQGFAKIAAGFAAESGVSRDNLKLVIDTEKKSFRDQILVVPSIPASPVEHEFEIKAFKSASYPVHALVLVGSRKERLLYCHVDLFSTFQWYVLLDDDYEGDDIYRSYVCRLSDGAEIGFPEYFQDVLTKQESEELASKYKRIDAARIVSFYKAHRGSYLKQYNHFKFHSLCAFANYRFLVRKANLLWGDA